MKIKFHLQKIVLINEKNNNIIGLLIYYRISIFYLHFKTF